MDAVVKALLEHVGLSLALCVPSDTVTVTAWPFSQVPLTVYEVLLARVIIDGELITTSGATVSFEVVSCVALPVFPAVSVSLALTMMLFVPSVRAETSIDAAPKEPPVQLGAAADAGPGRHVSDLLALKPSKAELLSAARWALTQDSSEGFVMVLNEMLQELGHEDLTKEL